MKKLLVGGVVGVLLIGVGAQTVLPRHTREYRSSCWASALSGPQRVHTNSWNRPDVLGAELTGYTAVHWQVSEAHLSPPGVPGPDKCSYQLVLDLEPAHARRLAADIAAAEGLHQQRLTSQRQRSALARRTQAETRFPGRSLPWHPRPTVWPDLKRYVPTHGRWERYGGCCPEDGHRSRSLYVNPYSAVAVVDLHAAPQG